MKKMHMLYLLCACTLLVGCTATPNTAVEISHIAGFWTGFWHGFIGLITAGMSLFTDVGFYEVHNNGMPYNFGFCLGITFFHGILGALLKR